MSKRKLDENAVDDSGEKEGIETELNQQFKQGDLTWVEINGSSWWPAQVVDEGRVSAKSRKKPKIELLVRLYGSYEYVYVDASKSNSEFEDILKRENKTMKEKFLETLENDISLILPEGQSELSELKSSKSEGVNSAEVSKDSYQQPELTKEATGKEADNIATAMKVCTNKEKTEGCSKRKQKLNFSIAEKDKKETIPIASKEKTPKSKKQKVANQSEFKNNGSSILRQSPRVASVEKTCSTKSVVKAPISENQDETEPPKCENQEEMKAKDLEIKKIVRDIIFGGLTSPANIHSPKKVVSKVSVTPNSNGGVSLRSMESNAAEMTAKLPNRSLEGKGNREDRTSNNEAQKSPLNLKYVQKKNGKGYQNTENPELEAKTPAKGKDTAVMAEERGLLSERQVRVMQNLALIAPTGSPYGKINS